MDTASLIGKVVIFRSEIEEAENYLEAGMRARIVSIREQRDEVFVFTFDCSEFEERNKPFESSNYYDRNGIACLTAREAGQYEPVDDYYLPGPESWPKWFEVEIETPALSRIVSAFEARANPEQGYVAWLEAELARAVEAGYEPLTPQAPASCEAP